MQKAKRILVEIKTHIAKIKINLLGRCIAVFKTVYALKIECMF